MGEFSSICCYHIEHHDYIIPPSSGKTCRLKKHAIPSVFSTLDQPNAMHLSNEERKSSGFQGNIHFPLMTQMTCHQQKRSSLSTTTQENNLKMNHKKSQLTKQKNRKRSQICRDECLDILRSNILTGLKSGHVYDMGSILVHYKKLCLNESMPIPQKYVTSR